MLQMRKEGVIKRWSLLREQGYWQFLKLWALSWLPIFCVVLTINLFRLGKPNGELVVILTIAITLAIVILGSFFTWLVQERRYKNRVTG